MQARLFSQIGAPQCPCQSAHCSLEGCPGIIVVDTVTAHQNESFGGLRLGPGRSCDFWSCFNHFYKGKLGKTGCLLPWKCAWGSCMTDPWTSLLSWTSLTSTTGDSRETVWHGDAPGGGSFARPSTQGGTTRGQIRTNEKKTFERKFFRCKQDYSHNLGLLNVHVCPWRSWIGPGLKLGLFAVWLEQLHQLAASCLGNLQQSWPTDGCKCHSPGKHSEQPQGNCLTGWTEPSHKIPECDPGYSHTLLPSTSMLVGPLQFGGLPRDHSCWHRHSSPKWTLWRSEIGSGSKLWPFEAVSTISIQGN